MTETFDAWEFIMEHFGMSMSGYEDIHQAIYERGRNDGLEEAAGKSGETTDRCERIGCVDAAATCRGLSIVIRALKREKK